MTRPKLTSRDDNGLRKLAGAVLLQAIEDLNEGDAETRTETWRWLSGQNEAGLSFALCCKLLGRPADDVRRGLMSYRFVEEPQMIAMPLRAAQVDRAEQRAS
jgi:hypothetical protein